MQYPLQFSALQMRQHERYGAQAHQGDPALRLGVIGDDPRLLLQHCVGAITMAHLPELQHSPWTVADAGG